MVFHQLLVTNEPENVVTSVKLLLLCLGML